MNPNILLCTILASIIRASVFSSQLERLLEIHRGSLPDARISPNLAWLLHCGIRNVESHQSYRTLCYALSSNQLHLGSQALECEQWWDDHSLERWSFNDGGFTHCADVDVACLLLACHQAGLADCCRIILACPHFKFTLMDPSTTDDHAIKLLILSRDPNGHALFERLVLEHQDDLALMNQCMRLALSFGNTVGVQTLFRALSKSLNRSSHIKDHLYLHEIFCEYGRYLAWKLMLMEHVGTADFAFEQWANIDF